MFYLFRIFNKFQQGRIRFLTTLKLSAQLLLAHFQKSSTMVCGMRGAIFTVAQLQINWFGQHHFKQLYTNISCSKLHTASTSHWYYQQFVEGNFWEYPKQSGRIIPVINILYCSFVVFTSSCMTSHHMYTHNLVSQNSIVFI